MHFNKQVKYQSTKTFGHDLGISCAFRQWRATHSHCSKIHGYALSVAMVFEASELDDRNWVMDFGGFKQIKQEIMDTFDHKLVVAADDPMLPEFQRMHKLGIADVVILPKVGCESFAQFISQAMVDPLIKKEFSGRVKLVSVEVREHGANSALYFGE